MVNFFDNEYQELAFIASVFVGIFSYYLWVSITKRYFVRKTSILRTLAYVIFFLATAIIIDPLLFTIYRLNGIQGDSWIYAENIQNVLSFGFCGIANAFLVSFLVNIFSEGKYPKYSYVLIILELTVLPVGLYLAIIAQDTLPIMLVLVIASVFIYVLQMIATSNLRRRMKGASDIASYKGILYIGLSGLFLLATFTAFILQEVGMQDPADFVTLGLMQGTSSIFIPIAWVFAGITTYSLYVGYVMPEWVKKRWTKESHGKKLVDGTSTV